MSSTRTRQRHRPAPNPGRAITARIGESLFGGTGRFVALALFAAIVGFTGGGSRADIQSLLILRPTSVLFLVYGLLLFTREDFRKVRGPMLFVLAFMALALAQLVPLPWSVWTSLPGRTEVMQADTLLGLNGDWRPLSLVPHRTWNTFFALFVPMTAICLVAIQSRKYAHQVVIAVAAIGLLSALIGYMQAVGLGNLHFYRITHEHHPVGLFANKNHQSVLLLWLMLTACWYITRIDPRSPTARLHLAGGVAAVLVLFPLLLLTGSRAGLVLSAPTLAACGWMLFRARVAQQALQRSSKRARLTLYALAALLVLVLLGVFADLAFAGRQTALSRLFEADPAEEQRWIYFPILMQMARDFFVAGSGFGSFEALFNQYEPGAVLSTRYLNQAHLDPMQVLIEGGVAGLFLMLAGLVWLATRLWRLWRTGRRSSRELAFYTASSLGMFMAASLVDYPIRTPLVAIVFATLTAYLAARSYALVSERDRLDA